MKRVPENNLVRIAMKSDNYESPVVEVLEVAVEKGFATTGDFEGYGLDSNDSDFGDYTNTRYSTRTWGNLWE